MPDFPQTLLLDKKDLTEFQMRNLTIWENEIIRLFFQYRPEHFIENGRLQVIKMTNHDEYISWNVSLFRNMKNLYELHLTGTIFTNLTQILNSDDRKVYKKYVAGNCRYPAFTEMPKIFLKFGFLKSIFLNFSNIDF